MIILAVVDIVFLVLFIHLYTRGSGGDNRRECDGCPFRDMCMEGARENEEEEEEEEDA